MGKTQKSQKLKNIALSETTHALLNKKGKKGETYDDIVLKLLKGEKEA